MPTYKINEEIFFKEDALSFYLLGVYITDGNIYSKGKYNQFRMSSKDKNWLELIRDIISPTRPIYKKRTQELYQLQIGNKNIVKWLESFGCKPNKSLTLKLEKDIPSQYQKEFILGVMDGDGSISTSTSRIKKKNKTYCYPKTNAYICSGSKLFIDQINQIILPEIKRSVIKTDNKESKIGDRIIKSGTMWRIHFNDSNAKLFLEWIYSTEIKINLPRKQIKANKILGRG